jgi:hypothetical protein
VAVKVSAGAAEGVTVTVVGSAKAGKANVPLRGGPIGVPAGATKVLSAKAASKGKARRLVRYLATGRKAKVSLRVTFTDTAGNHSEATAKVKLAGKK